MGCAVQTAGMDIIRSFRAYPKATYSRKQLREIDPPSFTYNGKVYNTYEATQKQRDMETAIRKTKRELPDMILPD